MTISPSGMTTSLQTLMTQFRARYPMGSLLSEFQTVHDGLFVVRAIAQIGGAPLSSGLAAEPTIEQAEDRAKIRAIEALGIQSFMPPLPVVASGAKLPTSRSGASSSDLDLFALAPETVSETVSGASEAIASQSLPAAIDPLASAALAVEPTSSSEPFIEASPTPEFRPPVKETRRQPAHNVEPANAEPVSDVAMPPMDLSDVIAQTSVELKRLGWTEPQGRKHLQQTYNKRSRQQLTDDELLDFLKYLQTQPSP
jgi:hypothetical protein